MLMDDLDPPKKPPELLFRKLDTLSVEALNAYIAELKAEIARAEAEIGKRGSARDKAEAFFVKKPKDGAA
jgi:uncharacterized small protein (DUF1192 family)